MMMTEKGRGLSRPQKNNPFLCFVTNLGFAAFLRTSLILEAPFCVSKVRDKIEVGARRRLLWSETRMSSFALTCVHTVKHVRADDCG